MTRKPIDMMDRTILRLMLAARRPMSGNEIGQRVGLSAPKKRLFSLRRRGFIKPFKIFGIRRFKRKFKNKTRIIKAPSKILWQLNIKKKKKK